jgi:hypothetical protein
VQTTLFDCLFLNGDSYSAPDSNKTIYGDFLSRALEVPLINKSVPGSNNDRIMRSSVEIITDLIQQGKTPMVVLGLSFIRRLEVWYYGNNKNLLSKIPDRDPDSSNNLQLITLDHLMHTNEITSDQKALFLETTDTLHKRLVDFYMNLFFFCHWIEKMNLPYFVFSPASNMDCTTFSLNISGLKFIDWCQNNPRIWKLTDFCFKDWAQHNDADAESTGHLSTVGHKKFASLLFTELQSLPGGLNGTV